MKDLINQIDDILGECDSSSGEKKPKAKKKPVKESAFRQKLGTSQDYNDNLDETAIGIQVDDVSKTIKIM